MISYEESEQIASILEKAGAEIGALSDEKVICTRVMALVEWADMETGQSWLQAVWAPADMIVTDQLGLATYLQMVIQARTASLMFEHNHGDFDFDGDD